MSPTKAAYSPHRRKHGAPSSSSPSLGWDVSCGSTARSVAIVVTALLSIGWIVNSVHMLQDIESEIQQASQRDQLSKPTPLHKPPVAIHEPPHERRQHGEKDGVTLPLTRPRAVTAAATRETWPMQDQFYASNLADADDTSTTIIFNLFKGPADALRLQLEAALAQQRVAPPQIWVMVFNSPMRSEYETVVAAVRAAQPADVAARISLTVSDYNHKFHGRFLLAYMATTKYVLIVDDDKNLDATTVADYISYMKKRRGVWGNTGHIRAAQFDGYRAWPKHFAPTDTEVEVDYLSGMWFLEQSWLEYFVKERMPSWETSEDMHLSHVMRKYLNLNTYGGRVALAPRGLPGKSYAATTGAALDLREYIFDHQLGRGNKVANVEQPIDTLVYAETVQDIEDFMRKLDECETVATPPLLREEAAPAPATPLHASPPWCTAGQTAAVFRGAREQDVVGLIAAAEQLCAKTQCEYWSVKPKIKHPIRYFNMREGFGQESVEIPWQTSASDVLTSLVGVLGNVQPSQIFVPDVANVFWVEAARATPTKQRRLEIYHDTVQLAIKIHRSSPINHKWQHRALATADKTAFPRDLKLFAWRHSTVDAVDGGRREPRTDWRQLVTAL